MTAANLNDMAALFCALLVAQRSQKSLPQFLRILSINPKVKSMALREYRGGAER